MKTLIFALFISASCFAQTNRVEAEFIEEDSLFNLKYEKNMAALSKELQANLKEVCELMQRHAIRNKFGKRLIYFLYARNARIPFV